MAFVAEVIPLGHRKQFENKEVWYRRGRDWPLENTEYVTWCVDHERKMFARCVRGSGSRQYGTALWVLCVEDMQVQFGVVEHHFRPSSELLAAHSLATANATNWYIFALEIPPTLAHRQPEIQQYIEEVLIARQSFSHCEEKSIAYINQFHFTRPPVELMQDN